MDMRRVYSVNGQKVEAGVHIIIPSGNRELEGANLSYQNLQGITFQDSFLQEVNFTSCDLSRATFKVSSTATIMFGCNLTSANLESASLKSVSITSCNLTKTRLKNADLRKAKFGVRGGGAPLILAGTDFCGADLRDIQCNGTDFTQAIFDKETKYDENLFSTSDINAQFAFRLMRQKDKGILRDLNTADSSFASLCEGCFNDPSKNAEVINSIYGKFFEVLEGVIGMADWSKYSSDTFGRAPSGIRDILDILKENCTMEQYPEKYNKILKIVQRPSPTRLMSGEKTRDPLVQRLYDAINEGDLSAITKELLTLQETPKPGSRQ